MPFLKLVCLTLALTLSGCGILQYAGTTPSVRGNRHVLSCGPDALSCAFDVLEEKYNVKFNLSQGEISALIQKDNKCSDLLRDFLSVFSYRAGSITWPNEIRTTLKNHGFKIQEAKDYKKLSPDDVAIVLVRLKGTLNYHWMCYPVEKNNILHFFGDKTIIEKIYIIKE